MEEEMWLTTGRPEKMLDYLNEVTGDSSRRDRLPSKRKLRLFIAAVFRSHVEWMKAEDVRFAIDVAEMYADGKANKGDLLIVRCWHLLCQDSPLHNPLVADGHEFSSAHSLATWVEMPEPGAAYSARAAILRCIVPDPFRGFQHHAVCDSCNGTGKWLSDICLRCDGRGWHLANGIDKSWVTANVRMLAEATYRHAGPLDPLDILALADALDEAGCPEEIETVCGWCKGVICKECGVVCCEWCDNTGMTTSPNPLLAHLRSTERHWRGCASVDAILGRN